MDTRLLINAIRRAGWQVVLLPSFLALLWFVAGASSFSAGGIMAFSMSVAAMAQLMTTNLVAPREVRFLPVTAPQIWRTSWFLGTVMTAAGLLAAKAVGVAASTKWGEGVFGFDAVLLSAAFDFSYAAILNAVLPASHLIRRSGLLRLTRLRDSVVGGSVLIVLFLGFIAPGAFYKLLPSSWEQVSAGTIIFFIAGIIGAAVSYLAPPPNLPMPHDSASIEAAQKERPSRLPDWPGIAGLPRLYFKTWTTTLFAQMALLVLVPTMMYFTMDLTGFRRGGWTAEAQDLGLLPFLGTASVSGLPLIWFITAVMNDSVNRMLRHLRTLLDARQLNVVLLTMWVGSWIITWLVMIAFHVVVTRTAPVTLHWPLFVFLTGLGCLLHSVYVRWPRNAWYFVIIGAGTGLRIALKSAEWGLAGAYIILGLLMLAGAACLNHATLTRRREVYAVRSVTTAMGETLQN